MKIPNNQLLKFLLILALFHIIKADLGYSIISNITTFPSAFTLLNSNIFIISDGKITVHNPTFTQELNTYSFSSITSISKTSIISFCQFSKIDGGYIFTLINDYIFIFDENGKFLYNFNKTEELTGKFGTLVPYEYESNNYKIIIGEITSDNLGFFYYYKINIIDKTISTIYNINLDTTGSDGENKKGYYTAISCNIMKYSNKKLLACFYGTSNPVEISDVFFEPNDNFNKISDIEQQYINDEKFSYFHSIQSVTNEDKTKAFICFNSDAFIANCCIYDINNNKYSSYISINDCMSGVLAEKVYFFNNIKNFLFGCADIATKFHFVIADENLNYQKYDYDKWVNNNFYRGYDYSTMSLIFSDKFLLITDTLCDDYKYTKIFVLPDEFQNLTISNIISSSSSSSSNQDFTSSIPDSFDDKCSEIKPYKNLTYMKCEEFCNIQELLSKQCEINIVTDKNLDIINKNLLNILNITTNQNNTIIEGNNIVYQFANIEMVKNHNYSNISNIDLGECENILSKSYDLNNLIIFKRDIFINDSFIYVNYDIYDLTTKKQIDLSICKDTKINILTPVSVDDSYLDTYKEMKQSGINILNPEDDFYNDICTPFTSSNDTDIILKDRQNDYYNENLTICQYGCTFKSFDDIKKKVNCQCSISNTTNKTKINDMTFIVLKLTNSFFEKCNFVNLVILKCFKLLKNKCHYSNSGSIIFIIFILLFICCGVFYFINKKKDFELLLKNIITFNPPFKRNKMKKVDKKSMSNYSSMQSISTNIKINIPRLTLDINSRKGKKSIDKKIQQNNINDLSKISESKDFNKKNKKIPNKNKKEKQIKANNKNQLIKKNYYTDFELNAMKYEKACLYDKRTYLQYYWSLLRKKNLIIFIFAKNDYNIIYVKLGLFIFLIGCNFAINGIFFTDKTMHSIYIDYGAFNFINHIPQIIYSSIISLVINKLIKYLALTQDDVIKIKKNPNLKTEAIKTLGCMKLKVNIFFFTGLFLLLFFWYYISLFCSVYKNTQIIFIKDTLSSLGFSLLYSFIINFLPGCFRITTLHDSKKSSNCLYTFSQIIALF